MPLSLCITSDYDQLHIAIAQNGSLLHALHIDKHDGNRLLVPSIIRLLDEHGILLTQVDYIAVNVGPAPYTSLRIVLATMNGLAYATHIPLVEVDALTTYHKQYGSKVPCSIALLNAFNQELFYALDVHGTYSSGYASLSDLLHRLTALQADEPILVYGNGFQLHQDAIIAQLGSRAYVDNTIPTYPPLELIVQAGYQEWLHGTTTTQAYPRYLKDMVYKNSIKTA